MLIADGNISVSASSNSRVINLDNEQLNNNSSGNIFNAEINTNGRCIFGENRTNIDQDSNQGFSKSNKLYKVSDNDTTLSLNFSTSR